MNLGADTVPSKMLASLSFFLILSRGASNLISLLFLLANPKDLLNVWCRDLLIRVPRKRALPLLELVISVFSELKFSLSSSFKNLLILSNKATQSWYEPLSPSIQSSAYLTYTNFLKLGSIGSLEGTLSMSLCHFNLSVKSNDLLFLFLYLSHSE